MDSGRTSFRPSWRRMWPREASTSLAWSSWCSASPPRRLRRTSTAPAAPDAAAPPASALPCAPRATNGPSPTSSARAGSSLSASVPRSPPRWWRPQPRLSSSRCALCTRVRLRCSWTPRASSSPKVRANTMRAPTRRRCSPPHSPNSRVTASSARGRCSPPTPVRPPCCSPPETIPRFARRHTCGTFSNNAWTRRTSSSAGSPSRRTRRGQFLTCRPSFRRSSWRSATPRGPRPSPSRFARSSRSW
mmetsp:Transcript_13483/g.54503  ORF Transcript_13483/g.54503 Transcript_13483/m.54503 type:complete len:246 (+) Transcript_13483:1453-2190(+)